MIKRISIRDYIVLVELFFGVVIMVAGCMLMKPQEQPQKRIVYLKNGGEFTNYCCVADNTDYDRVVNLNNVAVMRKVTDNRLELDGRVVILFKDNAEREQFLGGGYNANK